MYMLADLVIELSMCNHFHTYINIKIMDHIEFD